LLNLSLKKLIYMQIFKKIELKLLLIFWILLWLSLGVSPSTIDYNELSFNNILNIIRLYLPLGLTFILVIYIITKNFITNTLFNKKINYFSFINLFLVYFILQLIGLYKNDLNQFNIENLYLVILGFGSISVFIILNKILKFNNSLKYLLYTSLLVLIFSTFFFLIYMSKNINFFEFIYINNIWDPKEVLLNNILPRTTGLSRSLAIINIFLIIIFLYYIKKNLLKIITLISIVALSIIIWGIQARGSILIFAIVTTTIIFFIKKINLKNKIFYLFIFFAVPIALYQYVIFYTITTRNYSNVPTSNEKIYKYENNTFFLNGYFQTNKEIFKNSRLVKDNSSSGRTTLWKTVINKYNKTKIFGYGPQADRFLLNNIYDLEGWGTNVSNAMIYSFACGGYIALLIFIIINLKIAQNLYICVFKKKIFQNDGFINIKLSTSFILFFWMRSVIENSFAVFSIDFLLFSCSYLVIENSLRKNYLNFNFLKYS